MLIASGRQKTRPFLPRVAEQLTELDQFHRLTRNSALEKSITFNRSYLQPLKNAYADVIVDLAQSIPGSPEQMAQWAQDLITKYGPEHLTAGWLKENLDYIPDGLAKQRIISKVGNVLTLKDSHDKVKADVVGSGDIFSQWRQIEAQQ